MNLIIKSVQKSWMEPEERGYTAISFSLEEKPKSVVYLSDDKDYSNSFNYHICFGESLSDQELECIGRGIVSFLQPGWNLLTCGEDNSEKKRLYNFFLRSPFLEDTGCLRTLHGGNLYKILKKKFTDD